MAVLLYPGQTHEVSLRCQEEKPYSEKLIFCVKGLAYSGQIELAGYIDKKYSDPDLTFQQLGDELLQIFMQYVHGWKHAGDREFNAENIKQVIGTSEMREVLGKVIYSNFVQHEEKKS